MRSALTALAVMCLAAGAAAPARSEPQPLEIVGWKENVRIPAYDVTLASKNDTGAASASIHAEDIETFEKDDDQWVRFELVLSEEDEDEDSERRTIEVTAEVVDDVLIKQKGEESEHRYVIELGLCMDHIYREAEVNLADRSGFSTRMLLGREFLAGKALVDPDSTFLREPHCGDREE